MGALVRKVVVDEAYGRVCTMCEALAFRLAPILGTGLYVPMSYTDILSVPWLAPEPSQKQLARFAAVLGNTPRSLYM